MTGPEHYEAAQRLLDEAPKQDDPELERSYLAYAQVHATLAHTAATAQAGGPIYNEDGEFVVGGMTEPQETTWKAVLEYDSPDGEPAD